MMKWWTENDEQNSFNDEMMKWWIKNDEQNSFNDEMMKNDEMMNSFNPFPPSCTIYSTANFEVLYLRAPMELDKQIGI